MVCIDAANWNQYLSLNSIRIDWKEFRSLLEDMFAKVELHFYWGTITKNWYRHNRSEATGRQPTDESFLEAKVKREGFFKKLKDLGYTVRSKPISQIYVGNNQYEYKCNFDVEIAIDVMQNLDGFDILVLCSGDGDFIALIRKLKQLCKETHVIAPEDRFNSDLKKATNSYDYLNDLLYWVKDLGQKKESVSIFV